MKLSIKQNSKIKNVLVLSTIGVFALLCAGCNKSNKKSIIIDYGLMKPDINLYNSTINSIVSTDIYGRSFDEGDVASSDKKVGMFYFVWLGKHTDRGIFDVTKYSQTEDGRKALWSEIEKIDPEGPIDESNYAIKETYDSEGNPITPTPLFTFHYFSEPLYGYYCSDDPWVIARHIELLTMSGIDYISFDLTNISIYEDQIRAVLESLLKFQNLGWNVPKATSFLTGTDKTQDHAGRILNFYNIFYSNPKYDSLWLRDEETNKPIISIDRFSYYSGLSPTVTSNLKIKNTIWPFDKGSTVYDDMSWMDWEYPQRVYENSDGNYMSVSVTQHVSGSFGMSSNPNIKNEENARAKYAEIREGTFDTGGATNYDSNRGRGWDYELNKNVRENAFKGTNFESQWANALNSSKQLDEVFVTGWNEWIAYKYPVELLHGGSSSLDSIYSKYYNQVSFCDTADEEFSRDIEMTRGGYGDNFYLQNMRNTREFKFSSSKIQYAGSYATNNIQNVDWKNAREYLDFTGEVFARNYDRADHKEVYVNNTNRNDIKSTKVSHDGNRLYMQIETINNIVMEEDKENNMNVLLSLHDSNKPSWNGYQFLLNKKALTKGLGTGNIQGFKTTNSAEAEDIGTYDYYLDKNKLSISIPLDALGIKKNEQFTIDFKVADGIEDPTDIMNYYVDGDSAPIGRLNYRYNSKHF